MAKNTQILLWGLIVTFPITAEIIFCTILSWITPFSSSSSSSCSCQNKDVSQEDTITHNVLFTFMRLSLRCSVAWATVSYPVLQQQNWRCVNQCSARLGWKPAGSSKACQENTARIMTALPDLLSAGHEGLGLLTSGGALIHSHVRGNDDSIVIQHTQTNDTSNLLM